MEWSNNNVCCLIQLYLESEHLLTFNIWLCASQDRGKERYWKHERLVRNLPVPALLDQLPDLLREGREKLLLWSNNPTMLEAVTGLD